MENNLSTLPFGHQISQPIVNLDTKQPKKTPGMKSAVLCFGSNMADAAERIERAWQLLQRQGCWLEKTTSDYPSTSGYSNRVIKVATNMDYETLKSLTKQIELLQGREKWMKDSGIVPIDIDIVIYNDKIMRPADYEAAYFQSGFNSL